MAEAIPMLRREQRRHLLMNGWLIAGFIVVGTAVTNERGIFRPVGMDGLSATARAFIAIASPTGLNLGPRLRDVRSVSSLDPFEVTAPSRDVRRRLIDAIDWVPGEGEDPNVPDQLSFGDGAPVTVADNSDTGPTQTPAFVTPPDQLGISTPNVPAITGADPAPPVDDPGAVPEPATWAMLILGFGFVGGSLRAVERRRRLKLAPIVRRRRQQPQDMVV